LVKKKNSGRYTPPKKTDAAKFDPDGLLSGGAEATQNDLWLLLHTGRGSLKGNATQHKDRMFGSAPLKDRSNVLDITLNELAQHYSAGLTLDLGCGFGDR